MANKSPPPADDAYPAMSSKTLRMSYRIARGEQGVLTFEPYKSSLLPLWRFKTVPIAQKSSTELWDRFIDYDAAGDFVGMDMARKFIQMGMTRSKRYANHKGGRKYERSEREGGGRGKSKQLAKSEGHAGKEEKEQVSEIFREYWMRCKEHEGYQAKKEAFLEEQKLWDKQQKRQAPKQASPEAKPVTRRAKRKIEEDD